MSKLLLMAYVYRHIRLDTNKVFYIGIGKTPYRLKSKQGRNDLWHRIADKAGFRAEIIKDNLSWEAAAALEIKLIKQYGRINNKTGVLANMTDGGDGNLGLRHSKEALEKIAAASRGRIGYWKGKKVPKEILDKIKRKTGPNIKLRGKTHSDESKKRMSLSHIGIRRNVGVPFTDDRKKKISESKKGKAPPNKGKPGLKGNLNGMYGKKHTQESIQKNIDSQKKMPVIKISKEGLILAEYMSLSDAARKNNLFITGIQAVCKGREKTYKGFIWKYKEAS